MAYVVKWVLCLSIAVMGIIVIVCVWTLLFKVRGCVHYKMFYKGRVGKEVEKVEKVEKAEKVK